MREPLLEHAQVTVNESSPLMKDLARTHTPATGRKQGTLSDIGSPVRSNPFFACVANMVNTAMGAGVLAFPYAFRCTGWVAGLLLMLGVSGMEYLTLFILVQLGAKYKASNFQQLVTKICGQGFATFVAAGMFLYLWGSCAGYCIVIGDNVTPVVSSVAHLDSTSIFANRRFYIICAVCLIMTPLSMLRTMKQLAFGSLLVLPAMGLIAGVVVYHSSEVDPAPSFVGAEMNPGFLSAISLMVFAFQCHTSVLPVFSELGIPASWGLAKHTAHTVLDARTTKRLITRMHWVNACAILFCIAVYFTVAFFGYRQFGANVLQDALSSYTGPLVDRSVQVARAFIAVVALIAYPINLFPARLILEDLVWPRIYNNRDDDGNLVALPFSMKRHVLQTLAYLASTGGLALKVTDLGNVFTVLGSTCGTLFVFIAPCVLVYRHNKRIGPLSWSIIALVCLLVLVSATILFSLIAAFAWPVANAHALPAKLTF